MGKARRFRLDRETGIEIFTPNHPPFRLEPGSHFTTEDESQIAALEAHADVTEVKIPKPEK